MALFRRKKDTRTPEEIQVAELKSTYEWIQCFIAALILCVFVFLFFFKVIDVVGTSMYPTLNDGDKMLVSGLFYTPKQGDVVILKKDSYDENKALVKRVIAVEGQEINMDFEKGIVYVDGEEIHEDYIADLTYNKLDFIGPKTVPEHCVFVMGDNRNMSTDSRKSEIGMVDSRLIIGKAYFVLFPANDMGPIN